MLKKRILETCIEKQQALIDDFKQRIASILETPGLGNEEKYDNNDIAQLEQSSEEVTMLNDALALANEEMSFLRYLLSTEGQLHKLVGPGAIVVTDKGALYISVSVEQIEVDGEKFFAISTKSPLYLTMKGLTKGSLVQHNGAVYRIIDIF